MPLPNLPRELADISHLQSYRYGWSKTRLLEHKHESIDPCIDVKFWTVYLVKAITSAFRIQDA